MCIFIYGQGLHIIHSEVSGCVLTVQFKKWTNTLIQEGLGTNQENVFRFSSWFLGVTKWYKYMQYPT